MEKIRADIREIRNTGFEITAITADCFRMLDNPPVDPEAWTELMNKILEWGDQLNFIIREKRGRF
jgi:hypothetical protein